MKGKMILFPKLLDFVTGRSVGEAARLLYSSQSWSRERLETYQADQLRQILQHALNKVPYYQNYPRIDITGDYQNIVKQIQKLPILTKENIRDSNVDLIDPGMPKRKMVFQMTGGSTGVPTKFYHDIRKLDFTRVGIQRGFDWAGFSFRKKCMKLAAGRHEVTINKGLKGKLKNFLYRRTFIDGTHLTPTNNLELLRQISKEGVKVLWGYASIIFQLANAQRVHRLPHQLETIVTSSETLLESQREVIESEFGVKVFDNYSSREFAIAAQCEEGSDFHIFDELVYLEVVNEEGEPCRPGELGRVLITDLHNYGFPFIRYEIGDMAKVGQGLCQCGRSLTLLESVGGRSSDSLQIAGGYVPPTHFPDFFKKYQEVDAFQVKLHSDTQITVSIICSTSPDPTQVIRNVQREICKDFPGVDVRTKQVDKLEQATNGKTPYLLRV